MSGTTSGALPLLGNLVSSIFDEPESFPWLSDPEECKSLPLPSLLDEFEPFSLSLVPDELEPLLWSSDHDSFTLSLALPELESPLFTFVPSSTPVLVLEPELSVFE